MQAAVIGSNWGLVHLYALRAAGVEVVALGGSNQAHNLSIAAEHGVDAGFTQAAALPVVDLVSVATPVDSHLYWLNAIPSGPLVICEKPLLALTDDVTHLIEPQRIWVNYAFAFLDSARLLAELLPSLGRVLRVESLTQVSMPQPWDLARWLLEAASHPASFLSHLFGAAQLQRVQADSQQLQLQLHFSEHELPIAGQIRCAWQEQPGLSHRIEIQAEQGTLVLQGQYRPGENWHYQPLLLNGQAVNAGEYPEQDCWLRANYRAIAALTQVAQGQLARPQALALGLFDPAKAWLLESLLRDALGRISNTD